MTGTARAAVGLLFLAELAAAFLQAPVGAGPVVLAQAGQLRVKGNGRTCLRMSNVKGVARNEDILNVVQLAKKPLPNRPDGVVVCVQYSSSEDFGCKATDDEFDRLSEKMLDCIFLRCYREYEGSAMTMALRDVTLMPTFEVFYRGDSVCKIAGPRINEVKERMQQFGFVVSTSDLFGQSSYSSDKAPPAAPPGAKKSKDPWDVMADEAARSSRTWANQNDPSAPVCVCVCACVHACAQCIHMCTISCKHCVNV